MNATVADHTMSQYDEQVSKTEIGTSIGLSHGCSAFAFDLVYS